MKETNIYTVSAEYNISKDMDPRVDSAYDNCNYVDDDLNNVFKKNSGSSGSPVVRLNTGHEDHPSIREHSTQYPEQNKEPLQVLPDNPNIDVSSTEEELYIQVSPKPVLSAKFKILLLVLNSFMNALAMGFQFTLSLVFVDIIQEFKSTRAAAAPIYAVFSTLMFGSGGILGPLMHRYNSGHLCVVGAVIASCGCIISYFATNLPLLIFSLGAVTGAGLSIPYFVPYVIVPEIFEENKFTMTTVLSLAPGIGLCVFPYLSSLMVDSLGWRGALLIYAGIFLNCIPIGLINAKAKKQLLVAHGEGRKERLKDMFNLSIFRNVHFLVVALCILVLNSLYNSVGQFFVDMVNEKGFSVETGSTFLSLSGITNVSGRIVGILLVSFVNCSIAAMWSVFLALNSIAVAFFAIVYQYEYLLAVTLIYAFFWGLTNATFPSMMLEISGPKDYGNALGYSNLIAGLSSLGGGPLAGYLKDSTGSYDIVFYATTVIGVLAAIMLAGVVVSKFIAERKEAQILSVASVEKISVHM